MSSDKTIKLHDRTFRVMMPAFEVKAAIDSLAALISAEYADSDRQNDPPVFLGVLDGAFMFASELVSRLDFPLEVSFVKLASYAGTCPGDAPRELIGLKGSIEGRRVVVVEEMVDTGASIECLLATLAEQKPASVDIAALFFKPAAFKKNFPVKWRGIEIGNEFVVGFGMDYDGLGRNLKDVYVITE